MRPVELQIPHISIEKESLNYTNYYPANGSDLFRVVFPELLVVCTANVFIHFSLRRCCITSSKLS